MLLQTGLVWGWIVHGSLAEDAVTFAAGCWWAWSERMDEACKIGAEDVRKFVGDEETGIATVGVVG